MKRKLLLIVVLFLSACDNGIKNNFLGNYYLVVPDIDEQMALSYHESSDGLAYGYVIDTTVFAVGYNKDYIIAKQHPGNNRHITNYFIIPVKTNFDWKNKNGLIGPLTIKQFDQKKKELNIEKTKFSIVYKELE